MADRIKVNTEMVREMEQRFRRGAADLQKMHKTVHTIADTLEEEGLIGDAGKFLYDALNQTLCSKLNELHEKFEEVAGDLREVLRVFAEEDNSIAQEMGR